jgi:TP901 family phage tail tape measure protein
MAGRFSIEAIFQGRDGMTGTLRRISGRLRELGDSDAFKKLNATADRILGTLGRLGTAALAAAGLLAGLGANVVSTGMEFEATLMGAVARFPGEIRRGSEAFNELQGAAEQLGATTEFDAQQAASALQTYAAAGFNATLAISSLTGAGDLATVSGLALDDAAKTAADSLGALSLRSEDAAQQATNLTRLNDRLARATGLANTSVSELAEGIKVGGNMTIQSGQSFETFTALMASMAGANIKGAEAGTAIRNMFSSLQAPSTRAATALRKLHINVADSHGNMRDMVDIVGDLARATSGLGEVERNASLNHIFGDAAMPAALALMNTGAEGLSRFRTELLQSDGAAARMAATMRDTTKNEIDGFTSAIDGVKTALFGVISGPLRQFLGQMTEWIGGNTQLMASGVREWMQGVADNIETIKQRAAGIAVLITGFATLALGIKAVALATAAWNALTAMNPWMLAIMAVIAAVAVLVAYWPEISAFFDGIGQKVADVAGDISSWFSETWSGITEGASSAGNAIGGFFSAMWAPIESFLVGSLEFVVGVMTILVDAMRPIWEPIVAMLGMAADYLVAKWEFFKLAFTAVWNGARATVMGVWTSITSTASVAGMMVSGAFRTAWNGILIAGQAMYDGLVGIFTPIVSFFSGLWSAVVGSFNAIVGPILDTAGSIIEAVRSIGRGTLGGETEEGGGGQLRRATPQVVTPQDRTSRSISETTNTTRAEVRVRADPGTQARVPRQPAQGTPVRVVRSGA